MLVVGGIALFVPGPWLASRVFHHDFTASFLIFTALVNMHHFILDGAIWKLRDGRIASLLLNSRDRLANAASGAGGRVAAAWSWLCGSSASAGWLRISAAVLLLAWGTVDQVRHYLALRSEDVEDLQRAASLDSFDSSVQARLGHREFEDGHPQQAEAAWRKAIESNPADPAPRQALLKFLVEQKRFDEAFTLTESSLRYAPRDASLLLDRGLLAMRFGHPDQAVDDWNHAIDLDPSDSFAHLYLANELDHEGKVHGAAEHYKIVLGTIAQRPAVERPKPEETIAIVLRMADCQARDSQNAQAIQSYRLAAKIAAQTNQSKLGSIATVNEAALQAQAGKLGEALQLYQNGLQLDEATGDGTASAEDWFTYGRFLESAGFPERLAYACFVKSASFARALPDESQRQLLTDATRIAEKRVGIEAAAIRRDPEAALQEAQTLRR